MDGLNDDWRRDLGITASLSSYFLTNMLPPLPSARR
jgi:hypothetical protein